MYVDQVSSWNLFNTDWMREYTEHVFNIHFEWGLNLNSRIYTLGHIWVLIASSETYLSVKFVNLPSVGFLSDGIYIMACENQCENFGNLDMLTLHPQKAD